MTFETQTIAGLLDAKEAASSLLIEEKARRKPITVMEALIIQAASHLLESTPEFYSIQVSDMTHLSFGAVQQRLAALENETGLFESATETPGLHRGRPPKIYTPTELGGRVLMLF